MSASEVKRRKRKTEKQRKQRKIKKHNNNKKETQVVQYLLNWYFIQIIKKNTYI
jgi:hypothetical protein